MIADPARGLFMGNRAYGLRWLVCELHFERVLKTPRAYPKVLFLDEAVALAAGHRTCNMCRPQRYKPFLAGAGFARADDLDKALHRERTGPRARDRWIAARRGVCDNGRRPPGGVARCPASLDTGRICRSGCRRERFAGRGADAGSVGGGLAGWLPGGAAPVGRRLIGGAAEQFGQPAAYRFRPYNSHSA